MVKQHMHLNLLTVGKRKRIVQDEMLTNELDPSTRLEGLWQNWGHEPVDQKLNFNHADQPHADTWLQRGNLSLRQQARLTTLTSHWTTT